MRLHFSTKSVAYLKLARKLPNEQEERTAFATGFLWRYEDSIFLVTALHNLNGKHIDTGENIGNFAPEKIILMCPAIMGENGKDSENFTFGFAVFNLPLFDKDLNENWTNPKEKIDVAVIKITNFKGLFYQAFYCLNDYEFTDDLFIELGTDCYAVGFPEGFKFTGHTPLCKRASIASEHDIDYNDRPLFLIDTLGNQGMSGAPVYARHSGVRLTDPPREKNAGTHVGIYERFLGVYGGRLGDSTLGFQLGMVWKASVINEIVKTANEGDPIGHMVCGEHGLRRLGMWFPLKK